MTFSKNILKQILHLTLLLVFSTPLAMANSTPPLQLCDDGKVANELLCSKDTCFTICASTRNQIARHLDEAKAENLELVATVEKTKAKVKKSKSKDKIIPEIHWYQKLNPIWWIGNANNTEPPKWYRPGESLRRLRWYFRNPFHNFTFYVIGVADKVNDPHFQNKGRYPDRVFAPNNGWNFTYVKYKNLRLPFVSYWNKNTKIYIGWRERGNFGRELKISAKGKYK